MADDFPGMPATLLIGPGNDLNLEQAAIMCYLSMEVVWHRYDHTVETMSTENGQPVPPSETSDSIVRLLRLCKSFGRNDVLQDISLHIPEGRTTVILGPSGTGKSVLLKHIIGLLKPDSGEVWFREERVDSMNELALSPIRKQFGMLFQQAIQLRFLEIGRLS